MSDGDGDIVVWSVRQSALLRRRAAGELVNDREFERCPQDGRLRDPRSGNRKVHLRSGLALFSWQPTLCPMPCSKWLEADRRRRR
jgi:hypothetical protein